MKSIILVLAIVACIAATDLSNYSFDQYLFEFNKSYDAAELEFRREVFRMNLEEIIAHNSRGDSTYELGINQFADQTVEERARFSTYNSALGTLQRQIENAPVFKATGAPVPNSFDWRDITPSVVTDVKNQASCGSCWAFSSVSTLESHWAINGG